MEKDKKIHSCFSWWFYHQVEVKIGIFSVREKGRFQRQQVMKYCQINIYVTFHIQVQFKTQKKQKTKLIRTCFHSWNFFS